VDNAESLFVAGVGVNVMSLTTRPGDISVEVAEESTVAVMRIFGAFTVFVGAVGFAGGFPPSGAYGGYQVAVHLLNASTATTRECGVSDVTAAVLGVGCAYVGYAFTGRIVIAPQMTLLVGDGASVTVEKVQIGSVLSTVFGVGIAKAPISTTYDPVGTSPSPQVLTLENATVHVAEVMSACATALVAGVGVASARQDGQATLLLRDSTVTVNGSGVLVPYPWASLIAAAASTGSNDTTTTTLVTEEVLNVVGGVGVVNMGSRLFRPASITLVRTSVRAELRLDRVSALIGGAGILCGGALIEASIIDANSTTDLQSVAAEQLAVETKVTWVAAADALRLMFSPPFANSSLVSSGVLPRSLLLRPNTTIMADNWNALTLLPGSSFLPTSRWLIGGNAAFGIGVIDTRLLSEVNNVTTLPQLFPRSVALTLDTASVVGASDGAENEAGAAALFSVSVKGNGDSDRGWAIPSALVTVALASGVFDGGGVSMRQASLGCGADGAACVLVGDVTSLSRNGSLLLNNSSVSALTGSSNFKVSFANVSTDSCAAAPLLADYERHVASGTGGDASRLNDSETSALSQVLAPMLFTRNVDARVLLRVVAARVVGRGALEARGFDVSPPPSLRLSSFNTSQVNASLCLRVATPTTTREMRPSRSASFETATTVTITTTKTNQQQRRGTPSRTSSATLTASNRGNSVPGDGATAVRSGIAIAGTGLGVVAQLTFPGLATPLGAVRASGISSTLRRIGSAEGCRGQDATVAPDWLSSPLQLGMAGGRDYVAGTAIGAPLTVLAALPVGAVAGVLCHVVRVVVWLPFAAYLRRAHFGNKRNTKLSKANLSLHSVRVAAAAGAAQLMLTVTAVVAQPAAAAAVLRLAEGTSSDAALPPWHGPVAMACALVAVLLPMLALHLAWPTPARGGCNVRGAIVYQALHAPYAHATGVPMTLRAGGLRASANRSALEAAELGKWMDSAVPTLPPSKTLPLVIRPCVASDTPTSAPRADSALLLLPEDAVPSHESLLGEGAGLPPQHRQSPSQRSTHTHTTGSVEHAAWREALYGEYRGHARLVAQFVVASQALQGLAQAAGELVPRAGPDSAWWSCVASSAAQLCMMALCTVVLLWTQPQVSRRSYGAELLTSALQAGLCAPMLLLAARRASPNAVITAGLNTALNTSALLQPTVAIIFVVYDLAVGISKLE
jgi:hypothetical protein